MIDSMLTRRKLGKLHKMIMQERQLLLSGSLMDLPKLVEEREHLVNSLKTSAHVHTPALESARIEIEKNQRLVAASLRGVSDAISKLTSSSSTEHRTYNRAGKRVDSTLGEPTNDYKA